MCGLPHSVNASCATRSDFDMKPATTFSTNGFGEQRIELKSSECCPSLLFDVILAILALAGCRFLGDLQVP